MATVSSSDATGSNDDSTVPTWGNLAQASFRFGWTIDNFSKRTEPYLRSAIYTTHLSLSQKLEWSLFLNFDTSNERIMHYFPVYFLLNSTTSKTAVVADFKLSMLNSAKEETLTLDSPHPHRFVPGKDFGFCKYIKRTYLLDPASGLLPNDKLTLVGEITILVDHEDRCALKISIPECRLTEDLSGTLTKDLALSDVTLLVGNMRIKSHKDILRARCPAFARFLDRGVLKEGQHIEVNFFEPTVIKEVHNFIYTDKVSNIRVFARRLLRAADAFELPRLKAMCEQALLSYELEDASAIQMLILADTHHADQLKKEVINYICRCPAKYLGTADYNNMVKSHPLLLAELYRHLASLKEIDPYNI